MSTQDALKLARERELDLVEVAPQASPPVCRLLDYGKFRYMQTKRDREARKSQKNTMLREVRFRTRIGDHDREAKQRLVRKLLEEGAKVKVSVLFRGREITHPELGMNLLRKVAEGFKGEAKLEKAPGMEGRMMSIILSPAVDSQAKGEKPDAEKTEPRDAQAQDT